MVCPSALGRLPSKIFDAFPSDSGKEAHLTGDVAKALIAKTKDLFSKPPSIQKVDP